jgi:hypothetical protein
MDFGKECEEGKHYCTAFILYFIRQIQMRNQIVVLIYYFRLFQMSLNVVFLVTMLIVEGTRGEEALYCVIL